MADVELNPNVIYNKLVNLRAKPQSSGKVANGELQPVSSLRIDIASVTKDVNRYRACDGSACFYCREWAIFVYKKNFTWVAKNTNTTTVNAINIDNPVDKPKTISSILCQQFNELIIKYDEKTKTNVSESDCDNIIDIIVHQIFAWMKAPSRLYVNPNIFSNVEFIISKSVNNKEHDPVSILDSIEIEKSHYQISKQNFTLLKSTIPPQQCHHTRPEWKVPTDLDLERRVFNDLLFKEKSQNEDSLKESLDKIWSFVTNFLASMLQIEANRDSIFGKGCVTNMENFLKEYQDESLPFKDYWAPVAEAYKKSPKSKKANSSPPPSATDTVDDIDAAFNTYIHNAKTVTSFWEEGFIENILINAAKFSEETQCILLGYLVDFQNRIANIHVNDSLDDIKAKCADALVLVKDIKLLISKRISILRSDISKKSKELIQELEAIDDSWKNQSQRTTQGRLEKANNKEFRKRIKKLETTLHSMRQAAITSIGTLFPVKNLASICNNCLELLIIEGEVMEAIHLESHYKNYEATAKKFQDQREILLKDFEQGVETGRKVLSGIFGRLFLKEAWGLIAETLALKKQDAFLQSIDKGKTETVKKKKNDKDIGGVSQPADNSVPTESSKKSKKKKRKSSNSVTTNSPTDNQSVTQQQDNLISAQEPEHRSNDPSTSHKDSCNDTKQKALIDITDDNLSNNTNSTQSFNVENTVKASISYSSQDLPEQQATHSHEFQELPQRRISIPPGLNTNMSSARLNNYSITEENHSTREGFIDFDNFSRTDLILFVQNLLSEKKQFIETLFSLQQEVKAVTDRYTKLIEMSREREFQNLQLFEAQKKLEMDEAARYIQKLEARISQLENHNVININGENISPKNGSAPGSPNIIGGQIIPQPSSSFTLFPAQSESSIIGSKVDSWRRHVTGSRSNVRCGNCGGQGHISQDCIIGCRYCGDPGHLSEICGASINGTSLESDRFGKDDACLENLNKSVD